MEILGINEGSLLLAFLMGLFCGGILGSVTAAAVLYIVIKGSTPPASFFSLAD